MGFKSLLSAEKLCLGSTCPQDESTDRHSGKFLQQMEPTFKS
jgi:hypothetical protein